MIKDYKAKNYERPEAWDVVVLSLKLLFKRINFWVRPNVLSIVFSIPIITAPGGKAALYQTVSLGLYDPAGSSVSVWKDMKSGFRQYFGKAIVLFLIKTMTLIFIVIGIYYWVSQSELILRFISVFAFYGLVMWWLSIGYIYPILVSERKLNPVKIVQKAVSIAFKHPFESLLFAVVSTLFLLLGTVLLGPIMLVIPAFRAILHLQGYWFLSGYMIPGFMSIDEFSKIRFQDLNERRIK